MSGDNGKARHAPTVRGACLVIIASACILYLLSCVSKVAVPFMFALVLAMLLSPIMRWGVGRRIPVSLMAIALMIAIIAFAFPLGVLINSRIHAMASLMPVYFDKLAEIGRDISAKIAELDILGNAEGWNESIRDMIIGIDWHTPVRAYVTGLTGAMFTIASQITITLIFLLFMLLETPYAPPRLRRAAECWNGGEKALCIGGKIVSHISKYLRTLSVISLATGFLAFVALALIGVDFPLTWGVLAFVLNFIPTIGSIAASIPPILIALVQFYPNCVPALLAASLLLGIQFTIGNLLTPKIMGDALDLSPIAILIALLCWGTMWGIPGALLSVPMTVMLKIVCEETEPLHFIADLIGSHKKV